MLVMLTVCSISLELLKCLKFMSNDDLLKSVAIYNKTINLYCVRDVDRVYANSLPLTRYYFKINALV